jgi:hypothetical protein
VVTGGDVLRISEAKGRTKRQKELIKQINVKFNDLSSADENK